ncbi:MAG: helix-hairpin-helix domain-containing protein [Bacteroidaceae bacterium]|nr:helix-hairpin-helix domain-containing protein [Bacteroidaceae bacterium]
MKRLPSLTKSQRRALLVIEWVLLIGIIVVAVWRQTPSDSPLQEGKRREWNSTPAQSFTYYEKEIPIEVFPFDPNTADSTALLRLGLSPWQVRSIYRYRAKLGRYHTPEDFMRVPNLTNEQWERLKSYIRIAPQFQYVQPPPRRSSQREAAPPSESFPAEEEAKRDSFPCLEKLLPGQTIDINTADTALLKMIPGIASKRAARIVAYRSKLGGFVSVEQAMEAIEMPDTVLNYMTVSALPVAKINVNNLSVQQLMKHPYLNFYQAKAIFEHRRNKGDLHSIEELSRLEAFKPTDIDRLRPYITFD